MEATTVRTTTGEKVPLSAVLANQQRSRVKPATVYKFKLPITTEETLKAFIWHSFGVTIPDQVVVPGHSTPWRAFCDSYFARHRVVVWKASRAFGGKSYLLAMLSLVEALTLKADVKVLGGSGQQSKRVQEYIGQEFYMKPNAPRHLWDSPPKIISSDFIWGNNIEALMASTTAARGGHPERMRLDEADEMAKIVFEAITGQAMSRFEDGKTIIPAQTTISSTHHNPNGMMTEILKRAKEKGWPVHEWGYQETSNPIDGWLPDEEIEGKRGEVTARTWMIEYDLQEPSSTDRAIVTEAVAKMFGVGVKDFYFGDLTVSGELGSYYEFEEPDTITASAEYYTMIDWAKDVDYTIIRTIRTDCFPTRVVAWERRGREEWPKMVARAEAQVERYNSWCSHDATGVGDVVDDYLKVYAVGEKLVGQHRIEMVNMAIGAIENGEMISPMIKWEYDELRLMQTKDYMSGGSGHLPDTMSAIAVGWWMYRLHEPKGLQDIDFSKLQNVKDFVNKYD